MKKLLLMCLGIVLFTAAACTPTATPAPQATATSDSITNIDWHWKSVKSQSTGETTEIPNSQDYTITFRDDGTLSGKADCNTFTGTYAEENGLVITLGAVTMAACGDDSLDAQYLALLGQIVAGGPDGTGGLALETAGGAQRMLFTNGGPAPAQ